MIVADTNLVCYLLIEGERTEEARRGWGRDPYWRLPPLWRSEFLNVLVLSVRAGVLSKEQASEAWERATSLFAGSEHEPGGRAVLETALRYQISAYDAHFVVVAVDLAVPLVTGDRAILRACGDLAVSIEAFGAGD